jgi:hypothetical protein
MGEKLVIKKMSLVYLWKTLFKIYQTSTDPDPHWIRVCK